MHQKVQIPARLHMCESVRDLIDHISEFLSRHSSESIVFSYSKTGKKYFDDHIKNLLINVNYQEHSADDPPKADPCKFDWVFSIGGGRALDRNKVYAQSIGAKLATMATLLAHDGICSPVAVVDGTSLGSTVPDEIFVCFDILRNSTLQQIYAGVGDLVSNLFAISDWKLAKAKKGENINDLAIILASRSAKGIISKLESNLFTNSNSASPSDYLHTSSFLRAYVENLILSGVAMSVAGTSRPCSGAEHLISHAIDELYGPNVKALHGTQVLIATLFLEEKMKVDLISGDRLDDSNESLMTFVLRAYGMPITFPEIGISYAELRKVLALAPTMRDRYTVLSEHNSITI